MSVSFRIVGFLGFSVPLLSSASYRAKAGQCDATSWPPVQRRRMRTLVPGMALLAPAGGIASMRTVAANRLEADERNTASSPAPNRWTGQGRASAGTSGTGTSESEQHVRLPHPGRLGRARLAPGPGSAHWQARSVRWDLEGGTRPGRRAAPAPCDSCEAQPGLATVAAAAAAQNGAKTLCVTIWHAARGRGRRRTRRGPRRPGPATAVRAGRSVRPMPCAVAAGTATCGAAR
jgi:hypothetical protein